MIDDDEYYRMVGGSTDDVFNVLLEAPRPRDSLPLRERWNTLTHALISVDPTSNKVMRNLTRHTEQMSGFWGNVIHYGVVRELLRVLFPI
jgi:hypothetical protein